MDALLIVMTTFPDEASAEAAIDGMLTARLAACVQQMAPVRSSYRWQGKRETSVEVPLMIKTSAARYRELEQYIKDHHPYDVPEIVAWPAAAALPAYARWVEDETRGELHV
ncbi:divalent-cation tolerance protein CutA [Pandoraea nosoerga]|uniref:Cytochrome C biogenesis protein n=1 Tax=Pandoraea nosoerga TaxID=2508296 RepID=A0A5E4VKX3_9BURK|nr:divalent-cation tolerance protein CutA [Pandoraea nosoerga]MBN4666832.1 divalent-cation tolerance protein CutA [Pandoraea nosoerga]MBN4677566.1 divalent-cation tolerance protein CutA [Pandoraea nosoerga]MBN4682384.1 divalent-cation tolerance protein CutA [Pandoraea nosoerga]MBN4746053.1 divalent-cation tolerance protein CutA [Pandoraea nosoerga]VVE12831.1 cytochrome C biogenesis protein [Pandoraea nosoerga]